MMFRKWKKLMLLLLVGMLLLSSALAETDDGVKQLQMKLYNMGFMENKPDGVFGAETEAGLRALQVYLGIEESGTADEATLAALNGLWNLAIGAEEESAETVDEGIYPPYCAWLEETDGEEPALRVEYCARHLKIQRVKDLLSAGNAPERLEQLLATRVSMLWTAAINDMYDELEASLGHREKHAAEEQRREFREALAQQRKAQEEAYGKGAVQAQLAEMAWLEDFGVELCVYLHGEEAHGE